MMSHRQTARPPVTRRDALCRIGNGFGMLAFASLVGQSLSAAGARRPADGRRARAELAPPAKAKHVIFLFMNGGLSQVDSFDPKPMLDKYHGQPLPGGQVATERKTGTLMQSPFTFKSTARAALEVSELFPHVGDCADDICVDPLDAHRHPESRAVDADDEHRPHPGRAGRRSASWLTYGLGTDNKNLPGYVVLCPDVPTTVGPPLWNNAFLPAVHQGTFIPSKVERPDQIVGKDFDPKKLVSFINNKDFTLPEQRRELDLLEKLDKMQRGAAPADPQLEAAISSMEVAYRMQTEAPDVFDIRKESEGDARSSTAPAAPRAAA